MKHLKIELHETARKLAVVRAFSDPEKIATEDNPILLAQSLREALNWAWLCWHVSHNRDEINERLEQVVRAAMRRKTNRAMKRAEINDRGEFDQFLLTAALLLGNNALPREVADSVRGATAKSKQYQYHAALAGVIAAMVLGNRPMRDRQLAILRMYKPDRVNAFPSPRLIKAVIEGTEREIDGAIASGVRKYWSDRSIGRTAYRGRPTQLLYENKSRIGFDLNKRDLHWMWPYMEATFARLAMLQGKMVSYDDFWFPLSLVNGSDADLTAKYTVKVMPAKVPTAKRRVSRAKKRLVASLRKAILG